MMERPIKTHADRDAMGHMLYDYYQDPQGEIYQIVERDDGMIDAAANVGYYFTAFPDWPPYEQEALSYVVPGRALDLGCGAGRTTLYLQEKGHEVTAIDNSPLAIEVCRLRGVRDARVLSITQVGPEMGIYDNLLMMYNNFGLMGSRGRARWLLRRFHRMTSPGARLIVESNDIYHTTNPIHLAYQARNRARGRMSSQLRLRLRHGMHASAWFDYLMVSTAEMEAILVGTGWRVLCYCKQAEVSSYAAVIGKET